MLIGMEGTEQLAQIVAIVSARNAGLTQPERTMMLLCDGVEATLDRLFGDQFFAYDEALEQAREQVKRWEDQGLKVVSVLEPDYPKTLATIHQAPALLFYEGSLLPDDEGVAIVGSREITPRQSEVACAVAHFVTSRGLTVVSGLAAGVDACAHWEALRAGGRTVAVMGTPIERTYPREHETLRELICAQGGMVMSQFLPGANISKASFPMRNVTMSGYAQCTVIVAATEKSGTRHQALAAHRHGRPVILLDQVVQAASWARKLVGNPGIFVVNSLADLDRALNTLEEDRAMLGLSVGV